MKNMIKVVTIENGVAELKQISNELEIFQGIVGGYIEIPFISEKLHDKGIDIIINEEGKLEGLEPQLVITKGNEILDLICGNVIFTGNDKKGNQKSLTKEQFIYVKELINTRSIIGFGDEIIDCGTIEW